VRARRPACCAAIVMRGLLLPLPLLMLLLLLLLAAVSALEPLRLSDVCHARGSAAVWVVASSGSLVTCEGAIESDGSLALYVPDRGAPVIVMMPVGAGVGVNLQTASPQCLLQPDGGETYQLNAVILASYTATAGVRHAVLCPVPALPGAAVAPPSHKISVRLDGNNAGTTFFPSIGLPVWFFGFTAPPQPAVTWAGGGALITLTGFGMYIPGAGGSNGDGGGGGTEAAAAALTGATQGMTCRFSLYNTTAYDAPWHMLLATGGEMPLGASGRDTLAVSVTRESTVCKMPPMPRGFAPALGSVLVSVSPDPYTVSFCAPRNLSLVTPVADATSIARASREGGFELRVTGRGYPPPSLPSSTPRVSFGDVVVAATFVGTDVLACTVPAHSPGIVPLALSFDGQTFARGEAPALKRPRTAFLPPCMMGTVRMRCPCQLCVFWL